MSRRESIVCGLLVLFACLLGWGLVLFGFWLWVQAMADIGS